MYPGPDSVFKMEMEIFLFFVCLLSVTSYSKPRDPNICLCHAFWGILAAVPLSY